MKKLTRDKFKKKWKDKFYKKYVNESTAYGGFVFYYLNFNDPDKLFAFIDERDKALLAEAVKILQDTINRNPDNPAIIGLKVAIETLEELAEEAQGEPQKTAGKTD